ncbi:MAG: hypothetical protein A2W90_08375 [Bacteroidetes bacterium GWF2_42_66]|nr:MAG: hypothetical protein A2W92_15055 [Bacteroidetes bacterium GWA2_42_15]OFX96488.1 MAG: hypothetical protein A2W89_06035 [Bacteroidetes bacterium GWE2_42_39]OFY40908.1 MAG: hypothetical protein A2W90_08375 [Bacteroidetes bacterium GWF2_42_66]HBL76340.1 hypothetical protein [Prolixibacteraceae bacterium]HCR92106.1 hypothetical protein [Prolixibacteraceae bacterium]
MKKILSILAISFLVFACMPDEIPPIGEKTDYKPMLAGTWNLVKFEQTDADAESKGFPAFATTKDLTNVFASHPYTDFSITFNADGTFTASKGTSYMQMLTSGNWLLNDLEYPSAIVLKNGSTTQTVSLGSLADVIVGKLQLKEERKQSDTGKVKIKYSYSLTKN